MVHRNRLDKNVVSNDSTRNFDRRIIKYTVHTKREIQARSATDSMLQITKELCVGVRPQNLPGKNPQLEFCYWPFACVWGERIENPTGDTAPVRSYFATLSYPGD